MEVSLYRQRSTISIKLEHNDKMYSIKKTSRKFCRLYVLKRPLPSLSSPTSLPTVITLLFIILVQYQIPMPENVTVLTATTMQAGCFLTAFVPTCDLQRLCSCLQPPMCFLSTASYGMGSASPTRARLPLSSCKSL